MSDTPISRKRCQHHSDREAVARCPRCRHFFCRECITEHDDQVLCIHCLKKLTKKQEKKGFSFNFLIKPVLFTGATLLLFFFFYTIGLILIRIPAKFHEGTFWTENFWGM